MKVTCYFGQDGKGDDIQLVVRSDVNFEDLPKDVQQAHKSFEPQSVDLSDVSPHWFNGDVMLKLKKDGWYNAVIGRAVKLTITP